jgi:hypothetical protein
VTGTSVGYFYPNPADDRRTIDAEAGIAFDNSGGPFAGRAYFAYTDAPSSEPADTNIFLRYSNDGGTTWSAPTRINDDRTKSSQFFPRVAVDNATGYVVLTWLDCRNSPTNQGVQAFAAIATPTAKGITIGPNVQVSAGTSNSATVNFNDLNQFGDYMGLDVIDSIFYPAWADNSDSTADNPDGPLATFDVETSRIGIITLPGRDRVHLPDLAIARVVTGAVHAAQVGESWFTVRVANRGAAGVQAKVPLQLFLSTDLGTDGKVADLAQRTLKLVLPPHSAIAVRVRLTFPTHVSAGSYRIVANIDPSNLVLEANKGNNLAASDTIVRLLGSSSS